MNRPTDDRLHEWVRRTVHSYQAPDDPKADWLRVRRELRRQHRGHWAWLAGLLLLMISLGWWWLQSERSEQTATSSPSRQPAIGIDPATAHTVPIEAPVKPALAPTVIVKQTQPRPKPIGSAAVPESSPPNYTHLSITPLPYPNPLRSTLLAGLEHRLTIPLFGPDEWAIRQQAMIGSFGDDSTAYRALLRNQSRWSKSVLVCDATSSMYPYSAQVISWLKKQMGRKGNSLAQGVVFFTDCDSTGRETQPGGPPGQFFITKTMDQSAILNTLILSSRHTRLNQFPMENDLEALLFAQRQFPDAQNLILIADNGSAVKGMDKLHLLNKPVRIILAGAPADSTQAFQRDYEAIARQSGGSLHTLEDDLDPTRPEQTPVLRVGDRYYRYVARKKTYRPTRFGHRPQRLIGPIWW